MTRSRLVLTIEVMAAGGLLAYASTLPMAVGALGLLSPHTALTAVAFGVALLVLGFFNVWLPRGDAVDTTVQWRSRPPWFWVTRWWLPRWS
jgi:hypothetical protein